MSIFLNSPGDVKWLFDVHLKQIGRPNWVKSFVLHGNEDSPMKIELYDTKMPLYNDRPKMTFEWLSGKLEIR